MALPLGQQALWQPDESEAPAAALRDAAAAENKLQPVHRWVPWIAGFSAQFVADAIDGYLPAGRRQNAIVLDPFAGVGTTLVEALKAGCDAIGYEINPFAALAGRAKIDCVDVDAQAFAAELQAFRLAMRRFEAEVDGCYAAGGGEAVTALSARMGLERPRGFRSRIPFFSPPVEAKFLYALRRAAALLEPDRSLFRAALGATMISFSNYSYEPSLSSRPGAGRPLIENAPVGLAICRKLDEMLADISWVEEVCAPAWRPRRRELLKQSYFDSDLPDGSVSLLITSPPYMNNYHYVRNTRAHLHWLSLLDGGDQLKDLERTSFGKFWQTVRQGPEVPLAFSCPALEATIALLRALHPERRQSSGAGWANYVAGYFNDCARFLEIVRRQLKPGAHAVIVVGNSIIQGVEFKVDELLAEMALERGFASAESRVVRTKRVGSSIVDSTVRVVGAGAKQRQPLYDAAVVLRA